jgi:hypothetical protein
VVKDHLPIESLRMGGLPAHPLPEEPPDPYFIWGDDDGDPVTAQLGDSVWLHRYADIRTCPQCQLDFISAAALEAHKQRDHGRE